MSPSRRFVLILGGARSGKSDLAQKLAMDMPEPVVFLATAEAGDGEMAQRIEAHRRARPSSWRTMETPLRVADALESGAGDAGTVIIDCVTLWVSNALGAASPLGWDQPDAAAARGVLEGELGALHDWYRGSRASLIVVSNEAGLGLVPSNPAGRAYRDLLGWANQRLAALATEVYLVVAGIPIDLKRLAIQPWQQDT